MPTLDDDPLWYKDAILYELHVKCFADSTGDGIGDFRGLTAKLDYIQDLGVSCIWLLPFYPSPLRDDGYDVAEYTKILPRYGTLEDFKHFVKEAHARGLRVMTELVVNHTSDQHPWFQAARRAKPGSVKRDFYVWSDDPKRYEDARIIFTDTERSNWAYDEVAKSYYWHRFFSHQPDLNFDNPAVFKEITKVMDFWLELGVDGFRLDAIPYLVERDGTNCENLPETHHVIKNLRAHLDSKHTGKVFLAEANQWPEDVVEYFGDDDECHVAYHFPLMPRMFLAIRKEDATPIIDILKRTPEIPEACQWALFLRNHDELTLEMVSDEERDFMYREYASDPRMKCNVGIRRRLAPLMNFSRAQIELLYMMLFTLPGTPIIYYGDEIGMGDNIFLGDRDGVRTPMQWNGDRNGGFSRADTSRLFLPAIADPVCGYQAVNVESQQRQPDSLLNWIKRVIAHRKRFKAFGRGSIEFLDTQNRKVLAYVRRYQDETILVVVNLSRFMQPIEADLSRYQGLQPKEITGQAQLPLITEAPYFLTLAPHGTYWFTLDVGTALEIDSRPGEIRPVTFENTPELQLDVSFDGLLTREFARVLQRRVLRSYLEQQVWFAHKARDVSQLRIIDWTQVTTEAPYSYLLLLRVRYHEADPENFFLPLTLSPLGMESADFQASPASVLARIVSPEGQAVLHDATLDPEFRALLFRGLANTSSFQGQEGSFQIRQSKTYAKLKEEQGDLTGLGKGSQVYQGPTSILEGENLVLKLAHVLQEGPNTEVEIASFLTDVVRFPFVADLAGTLQYHRRDGSRVSLGLFLDRVENMGTAWEWTMDELGRFYEDLRLEGLQMGYDVRTPEQRVRELIGSYPYQVRRMGQVIALLHRSLLNDVKGVLPFEPQPVTSEDVHLWSDQFEELVTKTMDRLVSLAPGLTETLKEHAQSLIGCRREILKRGRRIRKLKYRGVKIRLHRNLHLGQMLRTQKEFIVLDFKEEALRPGLARLRHCPLVDVSSMLRSFNRAVQHSRELPDVQASNSPDQLDAAGKIWLQVVTGEFLEGYFGEAVSSRSLPADPEVRRELLDIFLLDRTLEELYSESLFRPDRIAGPIDAVLELMQ